MTHQTSPTRRRLAPPAVVLLIAAAVGGAATGCGPAGIATPVPAGSGATAAPAASPPPTEPAVPRPSGTLPWPTDFAVDVANGRYFTSPPFVIPMTMTIAEPGWYAGHLNPVFIDLQRYDGVEVGGLPTRMLGFGWPANVRGSSGPVPVAGLTPAAALNLLVGRSSVTSGERVVVELFGLAGERLDLHSAVGNNPIFGTADGDFGLGPELDARLVALPLDDGLLMVVVLAFAADLDAAWTQALPMLESVILHPPA